MTRAAVGAVGEGLFELGLDLDDPDGPLRRGYGGDAANTAVMAARLGAPARLCGRVGDDALGRLLVGFWDGCGVDTSHVTRDPGGPTGIYVNGRAGRGHRFDYHRRGSAGSRLESGDVRDDFLDGLGFLHFTGITVAVSPTSAAAARAAAERARAVGARVSFAVNYRPNLHGSPAELAELARAADVVFLSREDAAATLQASTDEDVLRALADGPSEVVLTAGSDGAAVAFADVREWSAAPPVEVVDAAGAGDALAGAYLAARSLGLGPADALARGVAAATLSCAGYGCALSYPTAEAVEAAVGSLR